MLDTLLAPIIMLAEGGSVYGYLLPIYVGLLSAERIAHALFERRVRWNNAEAASNIFLTVVFLGLGILIGHILPLGLMVFIFENLRLFELGSGVTAWIGVFFFMIWPGIPITGLRTGRVSGRCIMSITHVPNIT